MTAIPDASSLKKLKLAELVELCKQNSVSSTGKKDELISRLTSLQATKENEKDQTAKLNEDNLDNLDWEHDDLGDLDPKLDTEAKKSDAVAADIKSKDPAPSDSKAAPTDETSEKPDTNKTSEPKKAIRTLGTVQVSLSETKSDAADPEKLKEQLAIEEEKRKLRAQRFGVAEPVKRKSPTKSNSENPKKVSKTDQPSTTLKVNEDPELLKKRQEKFGAKSAPITAPKESKIISLSLSNTSKDSAQ